MNKFLSDIYRKYRRLYYRNRIRNNIALAIIFVVIIVGGSVLVIKAAAPAEFPVGTIVTIPKGTGLNGAAQILADNHIIKSTFLFKAMTVLLGGSRNVVKGDYLFDKSQSVIWVAYRATHGVFGASMVRVYIVEGATVVDIAAVLKNKLKNFDADSFIKIAKDHEGYLFPDTYFFYPSDTPQTVYDQMRQNFDDHIYTIQSQIRAFGKSLDEVIKMASIVEKEGSKSIDRRIIAGILWRRIKAGMPLQVDVSFYYLLGKYSNELTTDDLAVKSPYNLYKNKGLTPTPIGNPGLTAIVDTINPTKTNYLYFLSDKEGVMHYAATFEEHVANKLKYLQ